MESINITPELEKAYESGKQEAEQILNDPGKMELFLQRLEQKLDEVPVIGEQLSMVPVMVSLIKSYVKNEYRECPISTPIAMVAALLYLISPKDIVKDSLPVVGLLDDIAIIFLAWKYVIGDVDAYQKWRRETGREAVYFNESAEETAKKEAQIEKSKAFRASVDSKVEEVKSVGKDTAETIASVVKDKAEDLGSAVKEKVNSIKNN